MNYTKSQHEDYLNNLYSECYDPETLEDELIYLTVKSRGKHCTKKTLQTAIRSATAGTLLRRLDPIAFHVSLNDKLIINWPT